MILKCDCGSGSGDSYVTKALTLPTDFWVQFDVMVPQATLDALSTDFTAAFLSFPDPLALWGGDGPFLGDGTFAGFTSPTAIQTTGSPGHVSGAFPVDVFNTIKAHISGTTITWWLNGSMLFSYTGGWSPGDMSGTSTWDFGAIFSPEHAPGEIYYLDNVLVGNTEGVGDIFSDDFESGTLAAWDTTVGDASVVSGGAGPPALTLTLTPARDRVTATVLIAGTGFTASDTITATFGGSALTLSVGSTDGVGAFSGTFTVPSLPVGTYTVTVTDSHSVTASALFRIGPGSDTLTVASSAIIGSNLSVNGISPTPDVEFGVGDMIIHQGVPHVAWVESKDNGDGTSGWFGPYVASWSGSDWTLLTAAGALPDATDHGDITLQDELGASTMTNVCYQRRFPKLATDGTTLYLSVIGISMQRVRTNPGSLPALYHYAQRSLQYGFELVGSAWSAISDPVWGVFPLTVAPDGPYTTGTEATPGGFMSADISASPDNPGKVYFAFSDHGDINVTSVTVFSHLSIVGTDLVETSLATDDQYPLSLAGSGSTLTLYYGAATTFPRPDLNVWTHSGISTISATTDLHYDFTGYTDIVLIPPVTLEQDGVRYAAFSLTGTHLGTSLWLNLVLKGAPSAPTVLAPLDPRISVGGLPREVATFSVSEFPPLTLHNDGRDWWLSTAISADFGGPNEVFQLDLVCPQASNWIANNLNPTAVEASGRTVVYDDKLWWFDAVDGDASLTGPMVYATPICRGCGPVCAPCDLHIWKRV